MEISLRKANALQHAINEMLGTLDLSTEVSINEFEKPSEKVTEAISRFETHLATRGKLIAVLYEIRKAVAHANATSGIDSLLADVAMLDKDMQLYGRLSKLEPAVANDVLVGKLGKIKGRDKADVYGRFGDDTVTTNIFDKEKIEEFKAELARLKRAKTALQDSLLELNVSTTIVLDDEAEHFLARAGIVE